ncbi:hypothetical protein KUD11_00435 [Roseovarius sp. LXJ103]|uniref:hypothetical protein n=1 Tax=Roseovarius carneus TaxID=2853164 RepID=UPI000D61F614|nr:hypothetical protein [Roseovarius carneus]MBZ8117108.1 hypothetical protein [Roseovarius carneus]PWE37047.1 hypothetical protein DD563_14490 [Pelagicola sp. LXJ1103]
MKNLLIAGLILTLAGCGGGDRFKMTDRGASSNTSSIPRSAPRATGPISTACLTSDRKARSRPLCRCIQAVADQTLTSSQQRRAVKFYSDPHLAQQIRQSDRNSDEVFWDAYVEYGRRASATCS